MGSGEGDAALAKRQEEDRQPKIVFELPANENPKCIWDNGPTQRTGMCFTCLVCGATTSC